MCVCSLEKIVSEVQQVETEPCSSLLADDLSAKRCSEKMIQKLVSNQKFYHVTMCIVMFSKIYLDLLNTNAMLP